jgi:hypothetical protein
VAVEASCAGVGAPARAPPTYVVELPPPEDTPPPVPVPAADVADLVSRDAPRWQPPGGHGDPCATWVTEKGLVDCDAENEDPPDAGRPAKKAR